MSIGLFFGILQKILTRKAVIAAKRVRGLRVHGLASLLAVTTLLLMLIMAGVEKNPGPFTPTSDNPRTTQEHCRPDGDDNNSTNDSQQPFDRMYFAINHLSRTVSDLANRVGSSEQSLNNMACSLDKRLQKMEKAVNTRLANIEENQSVLQQDIESVDDKCEQLGAFFEHIEQRLDELETKTEALDNQSRQNSLLLFGIPRTFGETPDSREAKVKEIIRRDMKVREPVSVEQTVRVGSAILVRFQSFKQRQQVLSHTKELRATESPVYVREDFTESVRRKRSGLAPLMKQMREDGNQAKLRHDKLITDVGTFVYDLKRQEYQKLKSKVRHTDTRQQHNTRYRRQAAQRHSGTDNERDSVERQSHDSSDRDRHSGRDKYQQRNRHNSDDHTTRETDKQRYTPNVNKAQEEGPADKAAQYTDSDTRRAARATPELRGFGRGRGRSSPRHTNLSPGHKSTNHGSTDGASPMQGVSHDSPAAAVQDNMENLQLPSGSEASLHNDTAAARTAGSARSRLCQFAYRDDDATTADSEWS